MRTCSRPATNRLRPDSRRRSASALAITGRRSSTAGGSSAARRGRDKRCHAARPTYGRIGPVTSDEAAGRTIRFRPSEATPSRGHRRVSSSMPGDPRDAAPGRDSGRPQDPILREPLGGVASSSHRATVADLRAIRQPAAATISLGRRDYVRSLPAPHADDQLRHRRDEQAHRRGVRPEPGREWPVPTRPERAVLNLTTVVG